MIGTRGAGITRRTAIVGGLAAPLIIPTGIRTGHAQAVNRDRIILGMTQEPVQFNPLLWVNAGTENIPEVCMFDALWDVNEKGEFIPNLAVRIPTAENGGISADGLVWKIELRPDVKWTDGEAFSARDVEFTYQSIINPGIAIRSRSGFDIIKTFKVVDATHVEIELSKPYVPFAWSWQNMHIVPQHLLSKEANINTSGFNSQPIGTGPYLLKSRVAGSHMIYERNPDYHRGAPKVRQFIHKFVPDQLVLYGQAKTGEVDYMGLSGVPSDRWGEARALPERDLLTTPQPWVQFVYFNCGKPQFRDAKVRKALYIALEMQKSIDDVYFGTYKRTLSYLQPTHWAYDTALRDPTPDPELAARMLDEAGWRVGADGVREKDGVKMQFTMSTTAGVPSRQNTQALFQQNWKRIGVAMEIRNFPASVVWGEYTTKSQYDTELVSWEPTVGMDPDYTARAHSKQIPAKYGVGSNYSQYENAEVDGLLELGVTQTDQAARKKTYARIQEILADEVPFAPQAGTYQGNLKKKQLTGIKPTGYTVNCAWNLYEWSWA
jgi:peptide/nickel transport system substrate-binding protein